MSIIPGMAPSIANFVQVDQVISLTTKAAEIRGNGYTVIKPFKVPPNNLPPEVALFNKLVVAKLLKQNYVPSVWGDSVTLIAPSDANKEKKQKVLDLCDEVMRLLADVVDPETKLVCDILQELKQAVLKNDLAQAERLVDTAIGMRDNRNTRFLYARVLCLLERREESVAQYFQLCNNEQDPLQVVLYLEEALECDPSEKKIYQRLEQVDDAASSRMPHYYLFGYLSLKERGDLTGADKWMKKALSYPISEPLFSHIVKGTTYEGRLKAPSEKLVEPVPITRNSVFLRNSGRAAASSPVSARRRGVEEDGSSSAPTSPRLRSSGRFKPVSPRQSSDDVEKSAAQVVPRSPPPSLRNSARNEVPPTQDPRRRSPGKLELLGVAEKIKEKISPRARGDDTASSLSVSPEKKEMISPAVSPHVSPETARRRKEKVAFKAYKSMVEATKNPRELAKLLKLLCDHYLEKKDKQKAEAVARLMHEKLGDIDSSLLLAKALYSSGKNEESAQFLLGLTKKAYLNNDRESAGKCMSQIELQYPTYEIFTADQRRILHLIRPMIMPSNAPPTPHPVQGACKNRHAFTMDHPSYVGCYVDRDRRVLFTTKKVSVFSPLTGTQDYAFRPPVWTESGLPIHETLSARKIIQRCLLKGFEPVFDGDEVRLVPPEEERVRHSFFEASEHVKRLLDEVREADERSRAVMKQCRQFLDEFQNNLATSHALALHALMQASAARRCPSPIKIAIEELYADYLYYLQKLPEAEGVYVRLSKERSEKGKLFYLERAYLCCPANQTVKDEVEALDPNKERHWFRSLCAFMQLSGGDGNRAEQLYQSVSPFDPLINFAYMRSLDPQDQKGRRKVINTLAQIYGITAEGDYYKAMSQSGMGALTENVIKASIARIPEASGQKQLALILIDRLIESQMHDMAGQAVVIAMEILKKPQSSALLKRQLTIFEKTGQIREIGRVSDLLVNRYTQDRKEAKLPQVLRYASQQLRSFRAGERYVRHVKEQGDDQRTALAGLDVAFTIAGTDKAKNAKHIFNSIPGLDLGSLLNEEQLFLLRMIRRFE